MHRVALVLLLSAAPLVAEVPAAPAPDLAALEKHVTANPADRKALKDYLVLAINELRGKINAKDADGAIDLANRIDGIKAGLAQVLFCRGLAFKQKNQLDAALNDFKAARAAADAAGKPRPEIDVQLGNLYQARQEWASCLAALDDFKAHGGTLDANWYLARIGSLEKTGQTDRLLETIKEAFAKFPADPHIKAWYERFAKAMRQAESESGMSEAGTLHFSIRFQNMPDDPAARERVQRGLEAAYDKVTRDLGTVPSRVVPVIIYTNRESYEESSEVPHWVGAHYDPADRSIRVGLSNTDRMSDEEFTGYLVHEFTHLIVDEITQHKVPSWLTEGLAQIEQGKDMSRGEQKLRQALRKPDRLPPVSGLVQSINGGGAVDVGLGYAIGWSMTQWIISKWGTSAITTTLQKLGQGYSFEEAFAYDYATLQKEWVEAEKQRLNVP